MLFIEKLHLWLFMLIIRETSGYSYHRPQLSSNSSWNPNATTIANSTLIGSYPWDIFINTNNTIFIPNQNNGQIILFAQGNITSITNISPNLLNTSSLFVTITNNIYVDTFHSIVGGVSQIILNKTIPITGMNLCQQCWDIFIDINNTLYCSFSEFHQILAKSLSQDSNPLIIVGGTGSAGSTSTTLNTPRGIFLDETTMNLYVADCGNNRIQMFESKRLRAITKVGNKSLNVTIILDCPSGIILDNDGYLFIVDSNNHRIIGSNINGFQCLVGCSGVSGSSSNQLNYPSSLSFDSYGNLFVTDHENDRIQKFNVIINLDVSSTQQATVSSSITTANTTTTTTTMTATVSSSITTANTTTTTTTMTATVSSSITTANTTTTTTTMTATVITTTTTTTILTTAGEWTMTGNMNIARSSHTASILSNGKVLVTGGDSVGNRVELYDPSIGTWTMTGNMSIARFSHTASILSNGKVLVTGGENNGGFSSSVVYVNSAELYNPSTGTWTMTGNMSIARSGHTASILSNGNILVTGGENNSGFMNGVVSLNSAELYNPSTGTWTMTGNMNIARCSHTVSILSNGTILVTGGENNIGGMNSAGMNSAELYNSSTGTWTMTGNMSIARSSHTASILSNGKVLVTGGENNGGFMNSVVYLNSAELYNPSIGTWTMTGNMNITRSSHTVSILSNGNILVTGGGDTGVFMNILSSCLNSAELYNSSTGTWTMTGNMSTARSSHTASILSNGKVLVTGGDNGIASLNSTELY